MLLGKTSLCLNTNLVTYFRKESAMPMVGNKKYPYTKEGMAEAVKEAKKYGKKVKKKKKKK